MNVSFQSVLSIKISVVDFTSASGIGEGVRWNYALYAIKIYIFQCIVKKTNRRRVRCKLCVNACLCAGNQELHICFNTT